MNRIQARTAAFAIIFALEFHEKEQYEEFLESELEILESDRDKYITDVYARLTENIYEIDALISKYSEGWKIDRLSKVSLAILRLALCEMKYFDDIPAAVSINEAVELAKKYDYDDAHIFINGVLNAVHKDTKG